MNTTKSHPFALRYRRVNGLRYLSPNVPLLSYVTTGTRAVSAQVNS